MKRLNILSIFCILSAALLAPFLPTARADSPNVPPLKRLIFQVDCADTPVPDRYFECGKVSVAESSAGRYRETEPTEESRFGYRFDVERPGTPHLAVVRYPDDKNRCMAISDGTCYDLSVGVFTGTAKISNHGRNYSGLAQPISGEMLEVRQIFWPRWKECSIVLSNTTAGQPSACGSIEIYELDALPAAVIPANNEKSPRRILGVSYEDPCSHGADLGAVEYGEWLDRAVAFMKFSGFKRLTYPILWYAGPLYPSPTEPANYFDWSVSSPVDRSLYIRWTTEPEDWVDRLLTRFDAEKMEFVAQACYIRLGSLLEKMNTDADAVAAGADTINNIRGDGTIQTGAWDWTGEYNVRNFERQCQAREEGKGWTDVPLQYGEQARPAPGKTGGSGPIFNPLHPTVQAAVLRSVGEIAQRYGRHPSFKGLNIFCYGSSFIGFSSIQFGYDDYTVGLYEKETGIKIPAEPKSPDRFVKRYEFLTSGEHRAKWVAWRCERITALAAAMRDALRSERSDLTLTLSLRGGRDAGVDADALNRLDGVKTVRGENALSPCASSVVPAEAASVEVVNIFNTWIERWGNHQWWKLGPNEPNPPELGQIFGRPAEGLCRMGSEFAPDGFWWPNAQMRITPAFSGGVHYMRHYANAVARYDPALINQGGLTLDRAHAELLRPFAAAFEALPAKKFETVGESTDPVAVRTLTDDGKRYLYLVNREYYPCRVRLDLKLNDGDEKIEAVNLADRSVSPLGPTWEMTLGPFELQAFTLPETALVAGFQADAPEEIQRTLTDAAEKRLAEIDADPSDRSGAAERKGIASALRATLGEKSWAAVRQLLDSPALQ